VSSQLPGRQACCTPAINRRLACNSGDAWVSSVCDVEEFESYGLQAFSCLTEHEDVAPSTGPVIRPRYLSCITYCSYRLWNCSVTEYRDGELTRHGKLLERGCPSSLASLASPSLPTGHGRVHRFTSMSTARVRGSLGPLRDAVRSSGFTTGTATPRLSGR
jgi:hypothetical protein